MRLFGRFLETGSGSSYETGFKPQGHDELRSGSFSQVHFAYGFVDLGECYKITKDGVKRQKTDIRQDTRGTSHVPLFDYMKTSNLVDTVSQAEEVQ
jgi:hypothetical protein